MTEALKILQVIVHYGLHFIFPGLIAWVFFKKIWKKAWLIMAATIVVDLDHLFAVPIFDPGRCSIGFHPLHSYYSIILYFILLLVPNVYVRIISLALILHMLVDYQDCLWTAFLI